MEEEQQKPGWRQRNVLVLRRQRSGERARLQRHRAEGLRLLYLCSKIRRRPAGRIGRVQEFQAAEHGPRADVFHWGRRHTRWRDRWQRWHTNASHWWIVLLLLCATLAAGCKQKRADDWSASYVIAREKTDRHDSKSALDIAERGFRETGSDPVLNYKFRTLLAELTASKDWRRSLELLEIPPPKQISSGELTARRQLIQSAAHIYEGNLPAADTYLKQAGNTASSSFPELLGKISLTAGYLDEVQKRATAEQNYRTALRLARQYRQVPLETDAQINLGRLLARKEQYDEAIDQLQPALTQVQAR